jgi:uncharacterized protein HemX
MPARPRIRLRKPRAPQPGPEATPATAKQPATTNGPAAQGPAATPRPPATGQPSAGAQVSPPSGTTTPPASQPRPSPDEQIAGLRAWLADLDRKLGIRTYIAAAVGVLALAAAAAALVIALTLKQDAATNDDVNSLREQLSSVEASAAQQAQKNVRSLDQRLTDLEGKVSQLSTDQTTTKRELQVIQDDIRELRTQVSGGTGSAAGTGVGGTGAGLGGLGTGTGTGTGSGGSGTGGNSGGVGP